MIKNYLEINIPLVNDKKSLETLLVHFINHYENTEISYQKNINYFSRGALISYHTDFENHQIKKSDMKSILKFINKIDRTSMFISDDPNYIQFIIKLFCTYKINFVLLNNSILYYTEKKYIDYLTNFFQDFDYKILNSKRDLSYYLGVKNIGLPSINFQNSPRELIKNILDSEIKTEFYLSENEYDLENVYRLDSRVELKFNYQKSNAKLKYTLLRNLVKISKEHNLPSNYVKDMIYNVQLPNYIETYNYYYYRLISKSEKIDNYQENEFDDIDEAISHIIDLEREKVHGMLIDIGEKFYVCYENKNKISYENNQEKNRDKIIKRLKAETKDDYQYDDYSIKELVNMLVIDKKPVFDTLPNNSPLELILNKGMNMYNITGDILNFNYKKYPKFDRSKIKINIDFDVEMIEKIDTYYTTSIKFGENTIIMERDLYIPDNLEEIQNGILKALQKGYFISNFGIIEYMSGSEIDILDISPPDWFLSESDEEFKLLLNIFKSI